MTQGDTLPSFISGSFFIETVQFFAAWLAVPRTQIATTFHAPQGQGKPKPQRILFLLCLCKQEKKEIQLKNTIPLAYTRPFTAPTPPATVGAEAAAARARIGAPEQQQRMQGAPAKRKKGIP